MGVYIRVEQQGWQPGTDTLLYMPLNGDALDHSGHSYTITTNSTLQYFTNYALSNGIDVDIGTLQGDFTIMGYFKATDSNTNNKVFNQDHITGDGYYGWYCDFNGDNRTNVFRIGFLKYAYTELFKNYYSETVTDWHHYCMVVSNNTNMKLYINSVQIADLSISGWTPASSHLRIMGMDGQQAMASSDPSTYGGEIIVENKVRTAQEVADYYNQTKSLYGIA